MGILGGLKLTRRVRRVVIGFGDDGKPVELIVSAPKLQLIDELQAELPEPTAPIQRDANNNPVPRRDVHDKVVTKFGATVFERDYADKAYVRELDRREQAMTIAMVVACLGDQVSPTTTPEAHGGNMVAYYHAIWAELETAGVDVGAFKALSRASVALGEPLGDDEVAAARADLGVVTQVDDRGKPGNE